MTEINNERQQDINNNEIEKGIQNEITNERHN